MYWKIEQLLHRNSSKVFFIFSILHVGLVIAINQAFLDAIRHLGNFIHFLCHNRSVIFELKIPFSSTIIRKYRTKFPKNWTYCTYITTFYSTLTVCRQTPNRKKSHIMTHSIFYIRNIFTVMSHREIKLLIQCSPKK